MTPNKTIQERLVRMRDLIGQDPKLAEELNDKRSSAAITEEAKKN